MVLSQLLKHWQGVRKPPAASQGRSSLPSASCEPCLVSLEVGCTDPQVGPGRPVVSFTSVPIGIMLMPNMCHRCCWGLKKKQHDLCHSWLSSSVASEALTQSCQVGKSQSSIGLEVLLVPSDAEPDADANLHFSGFLAPATGAAEGVHQPVREEAPPDVILVANLCAQSSSIHCTSRKHRLVGHCVWYV